MFRRRCDALYNREKIPTKYIFQKKGGKFECARGRRKPTCHWALRKAHTEPATRDATVRTPIRLCACRFGVGRRFARVVKSTSVRPSRFFRLGRRRAHTSPYTRHDTPSDCCSADRTERAAPSGRALSTGLAGRPERVRPRRAAGHRSRTPSRGRHVTCCTALLSSPLPPPPPPPLLANSSGANR